METHSDLAHKAAEFLRARSDDLVETWIGWIRDRISTRTVHALPQRALRNHVPPVLVSLSRYIERPIEAVRGEMMGHLDLHAKLRLDQGYDLQELLAEFDGLAHLVAREVYDFLEENAGDDVAGALAVAARLSTGLRAIGYVTTGIYRKAEESHHRELSRRLEEFASTVAHEMRSPLHTINLVSELLASEDIATHPEERAKHTEVIRKATHRMGQLLENLRVLALAEGAQATGPRGSLPRIVQAVLDELAAAFQESEIEVEVVGDLPALDVETVPLHLALVNVLGNAAKYHDPDKKPRQVRLEVQCIDEENDTGRCTIRIEDNGLGIPEELQPRVFMRGFRANPEAAEGTGLGLAISREVLTERGGSIELESREGEGTTVWLTLRALDAVTRGRPSGDLAPEELMRQGVRFNADAERRQDDRPVEKVQRIRKHR